MKLFTGSLVALTLFVGGRAFAQEAVVAETLTRSNYDASALAITDGHGYEVTRGVILHTAVGLEAGGDTNVFEQAPSENPSGSPIMRQSGTLRIETDESRDDLVLPDGSLPDPVSRDFRGSAAFRASYEEFLNGNGALSSYHPIALYGIADAIANPDGEWGLVFHERFVRDTRSFSLEDNFPTSRDDNRFYVGVRYRPDGHSFSDTLHYENWFTTFEDTTTGIPPRLNSMVGLMHEWVASDRLHVYGDASYGIFGPFGDGNSNIFGEGFKTKSHPLRLVAGAAYELSPELTLKVHAGYAHASYELREGYSAPIAGAELGYHWSETGRLIGMYDYDHYDAESANFYADHLVALKYVQQIRYLILDGGPEFRWRHFGGGPMTLGPTDRDDFLVDARARAQVVLANRFSLVGQYVFSIDHTNWDHNLYDGMGDLVGLDPAKFVRHEITLGIWVAY
ncbi:MAG TPA: hypothetical protein VGF94_28890 [Kofleriaceae bacterium]|jgi:hypothetical protein